jgi:hypothetical protein
MTPGAQKKPRWKNPARLCVYWFALFLILVKRFEKQSRKPQIIEQITRGRIVSVKR